MSFNREDWKHGESILITELPPAGEHVDQLSKCKKYNMQGVSLAQHGTVVWTRAWDLAGRIELTGHEAYQLFVAERTLYCPILIEAKLMPYFEPGTFAKGQSPLMGPKYTRAGCVVHAVNRPLSQIIMNPEL